MKKYVLSIILVVAVVCPAAAQYPIGSYIEQTAVTNPAYTYTHLYTQYRYDTTNIGSVGFGSHTGALILDNKIGDLVLQSLPNSGSIWFNIDRLPVMRMYEGKVAIGRGSTPRWTLDVEGNIGGKSLLCLKTDATHPTEIMLEKPNASYYRIAADNESFAIYNNNTQHAFFRTDAADNIGIGVGPVAGYKLAVSGHMIATKVRVQQTPWPDYVFEPSYKLPSLAALEAFIQQHKHLPGIPSAKEVAENGLDLGGNQAALLEKIEELTLIIIEQNKKLETQEKRLQAIEKKLP